MKRLNELDIARGIAIFFLVSMHTRWWPITRIYACFDMALFFFISGYMFNGEKKVIQFVKDKIKRLYLTFVFIECFFLTFHKLFERIGITHARETGIKQYGKIILNILSFNNQEELLIQLWFLPALFITSLIIFFSYKILRLFLSEKWTILMLFLESGVLYILNTIVGNRFVWWYCDARLVNCVLSCMIFFVSGYCLKKTKLEVKIDIKNSIYFLIVLGFLVGLIYKYDFRLDVRQNICSNDFLYLIVASLGIYVTLFISKFIDTHIDSLSKILSYIGKNTMSIFVLHPLVFKVIGLFQIYVLHMEYKGDLANWGNVNTQGWWAYVYCCLGILSPLVLQALFTEIKSLFARKQNDS